MKWTAHAPPFIYLCCQFTGCPNWDKMADYQIGDLYSKNREGNPKPIQPGGPGTIVTQPAQPSNTQYQSFTPATNPIPYNEKAAMFFPLCSHAIRCYEIIQCSWQGAPAAFLVCPMCNIIQDIYQPPSLILDTAITPMIYG